MKDFVCVECGMAHDIRTIPADRLKWRDQENTLTKLPDHNWVIWQCECGYWNGGPDETEADSLGKNPQA